MSANSILQFLIPKDKKFFPLFERDTANLVVMSELLIKLMRTDNPGERSSYFRQIKELERKGDDITHELFVELGSNFITPFDREDIQRLASTIDDVADFIFGASAIIDLYKITVFNSSLIALSENINAGAIEINSAMTGLKNMKNIDAIRKSCVKINSLENEADVLFNTELAKLFETEKNAIELIKIKELLFILETATDKSEDVANTIETILIKYS